MKTSSVISKSIKEQLRSFWILLLSLSMGPFFIFVYFLITETSEPHYEVLVVNQDKGLLIDGLQTNHGSRLIDFLETAETTSEIPFTFSQISDKDKGIEAIKNKRADALLVIDARFSQLLEERKVTDTKLLPNIELMGDLTSTNYLISAVWVNEYLQEYVFKATQTGRVVEVIETPLGQSGEVDEFSMLVPGILIVSLIMLMFTASIAFVSEVEHKTIMRLKLSKLTTFEFIGGISVVQLLIGLASVFLTLLTAIALGFQYSGSLVILVFIAGLTSLSIIAFSLIIAGVTKSSNEVLVVGNFPMFLFMFFTGAAFPLKSATLVTVAGYPLTLQGLLSPTHAISALNKTLVMDMNFSSILPEIISLVVLTVLYFIIGAVVFKHRHLKLS